MPSIWGIQGAVGSGAKKFLHHNVVGVGWPTMGDLCRLKASPEDFRAAVDNLYSKEADWLDADREKWISRSASLLYKFVHEMKVDDFIFLPTTQVDNCINIGKISGPYKSDTSFDEEYKHLRPVQWLRRISRDSLTVESRNAVNIQSSFCQLHSLTNELKTLLGENSTQSANISPNIQSKNFDLPPIAEIQAYLDHLKASDGMPERQIEDLVKQFLLKLGHSPLTIQFQKGRIDISVHNESDKIVCVYEVKRSLASTPKKEEARRQANDYSCRVGARLFVITDADFFEIYDRKKGVDYDSMFCGGFQLTRYDSSKNHLLDLLRPEPGK